MGKEQIIKKLIDELAAVAKMEGKARTGGGIKGANGANTAQQKANFQAAKQKLIEKARAEREAEKAKYYEDLKKKGLSDKEIQARKDEVEKLKATVKTKKANEVPQDKRTRYPKQDFNPADKHVAPIDQTTGGLTERPSRIIGKQGENAPIARTPGKRESTESEVRASLNNQLDSLRKQWSKASTEAQRNAIAAKAADIKRKLGN